jgi:PAS domain S-box-containing protein
MEIDDSSQSRQASQTDGKGTVLRQRAEGTARGRESLLPWDMQMVSSDDVRQKLHELLVHQIELEMQNDELRRTQAELEVAKARYLDLYDLAPVGYCTLSEDGLILEANLTVTNLLGVPRNMLINQSITRFIHSEDQDAYYLFKLQLFEAGEPQPFELRIIRRDGTPFWVHLTANIMQDSDGGLKCRIVLSDINELKLEDEKLKAAEANIIRQNAILSAINQIHEKAVSCDALVELEKACLDIVASVTESKFSWSGELTEDGNYYPISISASEWKQNKIRRPDPILTIHGLYKDVLLRGKSLLTNNPFDHPDSIAVPIGYSKLTAFIGVPFFSGGQIAGMIAVGNRKGGYRSQEKDMLESMTPTILEVLMRKRAEESHKESERLLRAVIEGTDDPVFLKDRECRMLVANAATERRMGASTLGKSAFDYFLDKGLADVVLENDRRIMEANRAEDVEEVIPTVEGPRTFLVKKSPWHDSGGSVIGLIGVARDITDRKNMEMELIKKAEELENKDRLIIDFFINISHELKTPITLIILALEIIENYLKQPELDRTGMIKRTVIMKQNANRLSRLVGNILDITKIDAGFMEPRLTSIDIISWIHNLVESLESFALKRGLLLQFRSSVNSKFMYTDSQIIERIILNLVSNAIKHTPENGMIDIQCVDMGSAMIISVKDTGEGIPDEKKPIIFDRFRQVNTSLTRSSEGTGIGLSLIKALVELLQGRIWFESILGEGSEFFVELPVLQTDVKHQLIEQQGMSIDRRIEMEFSDINFG